MAVNIFEQYGVKEVANVAFYAISKDGDIEPGDIVLFLDSLKVSSIETTAETADATGGWGNPKLVSWDYGKEITLTLEDALISFESLRIMLGGKIKKPSADGTTKVKVHMTEQATVTTNNTVPILYDHLDSSYTYDLNRTTFKYINLTTGERGRASLNGDNWSGFTAKAGDIVRFFWTIEANSEDKAVEITISPDTFPGTFGQLMCA